MIIPFPGHDEVALAKAAAEAAATVASASVASDLTTLGTQKLGRRQNSLILSFLAVFVGDIAHSFWLRTRFERLVTPGTQKLGRRQNSSIWSFLAVFVCYSTQFLAPDTI